MARATDGSCGIDKGGLGAVGDDLLEDDEGLATMGEMRTDRFPRDEIANPVVMMRWEDA